LVASACASQPSATERSKTSPLVERHVWAVNIGGLAYVASDGTRYEAESAVRGGQVRTLDVVKGPQDDFLL
jgi:hypothetical protein